MDYEVLDTITSADLAFRVTAGSRDELFLKGARALMAIMVENYQDISPTHEHIIELADPGLEILYYRFLQEFLFLRDAEILLLLPRSVSIHEKDGILSLTCTAWGEQADRNRHIFNTDIKAVTMHHLKVEQSSSGWSAIAVLDL
jgi:SHS2 domain-containing protein